MMSVDLLKVLILLLILLDADKSFSSLTTADDEHHKHTYRVVVVHFVGLFHPRLVSFNGE